MSGLEKSLDSIIGDTPQPRREGRGSRAPRGPRGPNSLSSRIGKVRESRPPKHDAGIPRQIVTAAGSRQLLRVKNIHPDLDGQDLSKLFEAVGPVDFVKFDPRNESIAYVCFQSNNARNNGLAVSKYDGRKAMGETLVVENAVSLADRITAAARPLPRSSNNGDTRPSKGQKQQKPQKQRAPAKPKPQKKSIDDLDSELEAYMSGKSTDAAKTEAKLDNEMDEYWKSKDQEQPKGDDVAME